MQGIKFRKCKYTCTCACPSRNLCIQSFLTSLIWSESYSSSSLTKSSSSKLVVFRPFFPLPFFPFLPFLALPSSANTLLRASSAAVAPAKKLSLKWSSSSSSESSSGSLIHFSRSSLGGKERERERKRESQS